MHASFDGMHVHHYAIEETRSEDDILNVKHSKHNKSTRISDPFVQTLVKTISHSLLASRKEKMPRKALLPKRCKECKEFLFKSQQPHSHLPQHVAKDRICTEHNHDCATAGRVTCKSKKRKMRTFERASRV